MVVFEVFDAVSPLQRVRLDMAKHHSRNDVHNSTDSTRAIRLNMRAEHGSVNWPEYAVCKPGPVRLCDSKDLFGIFGRPKAVEMETEGADTFTLELGEALLLEHLECQ